MSYTATQYYQLGDLNNSVNKLNPAIGPPVPGDKNLDPHSQFNQDTGLSFTTYDYNPLYIIRQVAVEGGASGQTAVTLKLYYATGAYKTWTFSVAAYSQLIFEGDIVGIDHSGTTATLVFPFF